MTKSARLARSALRKLGDEGRVFGAGQSLLQNLQDASEIETQQGVGIEP